MADQEVSNIVLSIKYLVVVSVQEILLNTASGTDGSRGGRQCCIK